MTVGDAKLVVVADTNNLKIFEAQGLKITKTLVEMDLNNHHTRQEKHQGYFHHQSTPAHFFDPHTSPKDIERHDAAMLVSDLIDKLLKVGKSYQEIIIVAAHKVLGEIRKNLPHPVKQLVSKEIPKDLIHEDTNKLANIIFA